METESNDMVLVNFLKEKLAQLDKQRDAILTVLATLGDNGQMSIFGQPIVLSSAKQEVSLHSQVIDATVELCTTTGKSARTGEILLYLQNKGIGKDRKRMLLTGALFREAAKKDGRIRKMGKGKFDIHRSKQKNQPDE